MELRSSMILTLTLLTVIQCGATLLPSYAGTLKKAKIPQHYIIRHVPEITQYPQLKNGCEVTSLTMLLNYRDVDVSKMTLAAQVKKDPTPLIGNVDDIESWGDPNVGFVGDIYTSPGYGVYHHPLLELAQRYVGKRAIDLTGDSFTTIENFVSHNDPVEVITSFYFKPQGDDWESYTDEFHHRERINVDEHAVLIVGYSPRYVWINNPAIEFGYEVVPKTPFTLAWKQFGSQAITILQKRNPQKKPKSDSVTEFVYL